MKTLAELNANATTREWSGLTLRSEYRVGRVGHRRSGAKLHLLRVDIIVAHPTHPHRVGQVFSAGALCNGNGQHVGQVVAGYDTDAVNCTKCRGGK